ncbi:4Fe-4S ferredoxin [Pelobium manganitolerans]|uniref:4Fe-4S ferredoxin n=1 Tax=Pelobium manganitolerans TaxID=1842495 RepID=A0A419S927_9SPHI|nr:4Fe-4S binding protein [Pelobium manganitolerans]RKD18285.1 4Fe-4S ferredoxin [Pelobium manganitolerans]
MILKTAFKGLQTSWKGLVLTLKHFFEARKSKVVADVKSPNYFDQQNGIATVQYPRQELPVPEVGRYQLDVVIDDCIVCDLCAKICPVDCIEIESIKATEAIGKTSDGSVKRLYAAKFDIDMAKCMFCGLCTTVCPTECITMTNGYDRSFSLVTDLTYHFSDMTEEEAELRREELEAQLAERKAAKEAAMKK